MSVLDRYEAPVLTQPPFEGRVTGMSQLVQWFMANANVLALLATIGVAVLLVCCLGCTRCSSRDKDDLFRHHGA